jgi:DNA-binding transcriptional LysR family regulator
VPSGHPFARRRGIRLAELAGQPLITTPPGSGIRAVLDAGFAAAGLRPRIAFEASVPTVVTRLAERGLGIAVLPAAENPAPEPGDLIEIPIVQPQLRGRLVLAWRADPPPGPATRALARHFVNPDDS